MAHYGIPAGPEPPVARAPPGEEVRGPYYHNITITTHILSLSIYIYVYVYIIIMIITILLLLLLY